MSFGVTTEGFVIKRFSDIIEAIEEAEKSEIGLIDVSDGTIFNQFNNIITNQLSEIWEKMYSVYLSNSPSNAEGLSLDYVVSQNGISRLPALETNINIAMMGTFTTTIPAGTQVSSVIDNELYTLQNDKVLSPDQQLKTFISIKDIVDLATYTILIDGSGLYQYVASASATELEILTGLYNVINLDAGAVVDVTLLDSAIEFNAKTSAFDTVSDLKLNFHNSGSFKSDEKGAIVALEGTLTSIETPVTGLDSVTNFDNGVKGRDIEDDVTLRARRLQSLNIIGAGTLPAMISRALNDIEDVVAVTGYENTDSVPDGEGRPGHSVEMVVVGGDDQDIVDTIWLTKPGGIKTYGNDSETIIDGNGDPQTIYFSRPIIKYAWLSCDVTLYDEETFPTDGEEQIKNQIVAFGESLGIGVDILPQRFHGPIYQIPGIGFLGIRVAVTDTPGGTPSYGAVNDPIAIIANETSDWTTTRLIINFP